MMEDELIGGFSMDDKCIVNRKKLLPLCTIHGNCKHIRTPTSYLDFLDF